MKNILNKTILCVAMTSLCVGCASDLIVKNEKGNDVGGVPVHSLLLSKITKQVNYELVDKKDDVKAASYCTPELIEFYEPLALGDLYYVGMKSAWFGKGEFSITFDADKLKQVTLNSDPKIPENIDATAKLVSSVAGVAKAVATPLSANALELKIQPLFKDKLNPQTGGLSINEFKGDPTLTASQIKAKYCIKTSESIVGEPVIVHPINNF